MNVDTPRAALFEPDVPPVCTLGLAAGPRPPRLEGLSGSPLEGEDTARRNPLEPGVVAPWPLELGPALPPLLMEASSEKSPDSSMAAFPLSSPPKRLRAVPFMLFEGEAQYEGGSRDEYRASSLDWGDSLAMRFAGDPEPPPWVVDLLEWVELEREASSTKSNVNRGDDDCC